MRKLLQNQKLIKTVRMLRPWITFLVIFLILRYTGVLSNISIYANTALMKTGIMDVDTQEAKFEEPFDYNFSILDLKGNRVGMEQFKGKVVFINLWATWCGPCLAEMPSIQGLYDHVNKDKVVFIILDWFEEPGKVSKLLTEKNFTFPVYLVNKDVPTQLNVPSIPTTFVISPQGKIVTKKTGTANYNTENFKKYLEEVEKQ